jgi:ribosome biogenesis protein MAK21
MKGIIVREITSIMFHAPSSSSSTTTNAAATNKHIRFGDDSTSGKGKTTKKEPERKAKNGHVRYYAIITLNQIVLAPGDTAVSLQLINIYFDIFREVLGDHSSADNDGGAEHGEDGEGADGEGEVKVDSKGRVRDKNNQYQQKQKGKKGQKKGEGEVKGAAGFVEVEDSSSKLISAILTGVNRALPFAKLQNADSGCV